MYPLPTMYNALTIYERRVVREQYVEVQAGLCQHCKAPLSDAAPEHITRLAIDTTLFPSGFFSSPVHLHHDHKTGLTIGAVHAQCNAVLWQYHGE